MSPNMLNTYVAKDTAEEHIDYAKRMIEFQNSGKFDLYIYEAMNLAKKMGVKVCDIYSKWKKIREAQDTTLLLTNRVNHPIREIHELFADGLFQILFDKKNTG